MAWELGSHRNVEVREQLATMGVDVAPLLGLSCYAYVGKGCPSDLCSSYMVEIENFHKMFIR